jgi:hypothetical protein
MSDLRRRRSVAGHEEPPRSGGDNTQTADSCAASSSKANAQDSATDQPAVDHHETLESIEPRSKQRRRRSVTGHEGWLYDSDVTNRMADDSMPRSPGVAARTPATAQTTTNYYAPLGLDEFRLLRIHHVVEDPQPAYTTRPMMFCELKTFGLDSAPA